ncbi:MAG: hypothetical protein JXQ65_15655, partial [Candidatus Marinimicrobia bacterium]|nr:hypothetical protein [Candidatus Neomarinimicrobiota bacterium]
ITVRIQNNSTVPTDTSRASIEVNYSDYRMNFVIPPLEPGQNYMIGHDLIIPESGNYTAEVMLDIDEQVDEENEDNNFRQITFSVEPVNLPDLEIIGLYLNPTNPTTMDSVSINATVKNSSTISAGISKAVIQITGEINPPKIDIPSLGISEIYNIERKILINQAGSYTISAEADCDDEVEELDENNNNEELILEVVNHSKPDLIIESFIISPSSPTNKDTITFTIVVKNIGNVLAEKSTVATKIHGEKSLTTYGIPSLYPGESYTVTRQSKINIIGFISAEAWADYDMDVDESDETNNDVKIYFTVN